MQQLVPPLLRALAANETGRDAFALLRTLRCNAATPRPKEA